MAFLTDLDEVLRSRGVKVKTHPGWKTRGYNGWSFVAVQGTLWHHTATPSARYSDGAPTLDICMYGRPGLAGPLCQIVLGRDGTAHVIAAGWGNHAGPGSYPGIPRDEGNQRLIGVEMESSGLPPYDWTPAQLAAIPVLRDALRDGYGHKLDIAHFEWSTQGKIDPAGLPGGMNWLRTAKANTKVTAQAATPITPIKTGFDQLMEQIMSWYDSKEDFEARMAYLPNSYVGKNDTEDVFAKINKIPNRTVSLLLNYDNTSRSDRSLYALFIDAGLNSFQANMGVAALKQGQAALEGQIAGLIGAIKAVSGGEKFDEAKLIEGVAKAAEAAAERGVSNAIGSIDANVTVNLATNEKAELDTTQENE
ncbi:N-acetylmuramoyl-L-alanine amidase [Arthrobacter sp. VKM Ac-2550]|uniref:peptidoglycan recognition protein family protein n=1 Tax=Crystallibacter permensis TaxID=1938888 RepID=UPI002226E7B6|nr:N-acetylmuramoyl-L-alanine amidase [Arthrobacter sp. VKM Ac-2550]MCW2132872.1 hypothetical protein [Arthrobacter sp. VKM Ac-2550]